MFTTYDLNFSICSQTNGSSNTRGSLADDRPPLMGVKASCASHIVSKIKSEALLQINSPHSVQNVGTSGVNEERGLSLKSREGIQNIKKRLPIVIFRKTCISPLCPEWPMWGRKNWFISRWIKSFKNVLNAHKESYSQSQWTPPLADKGEPSLFSTGGRIIAWLSRLPWVLAIHWNQKQPSLGILKLSDINHSDILLDRQWNNERRRAHSWKFYSESSLGLLRGRGLRSGHWVGVVVITKIGLRRWPMKRHADGGEGDVIFKALWDGFLITAEGHSVTNVNTVSSCENSRLSLSAFHLRGFFGRFPLFLSCPMRRISCVFWHACGRMPGICGPFHSQAPGPFITGLFNQLAVTKLGPQPLLMLITSHLPSIWLLYCCCWLG